MAISFKLMAIKIVVNEVEHLTPINFSLHFSELWNNINASFQTTNIQMYICFKLFLQAIFLTGVR